jgi:hypothetical protein
MAQHLGCCCPVVVTRMQSGGRYSRQAGLASAATATATAAAATALLLLLLDSLTPSSHLTPTPSHCSTGETPPAELLCPSDCGLHSQCFIKLDGFCCASKCTRQQQPCALHITFTQRPAKVACRQFCLSTSLVGAPSGTACRHDVSCAALPPTLPHSSYQLHCTPSIVTKDWGGGHCFMVTASTCPPPPDARASAAWLVWSQGTTQQQQSICPGPYWQCYLLNCELASWYGHSLAYCCGCSLAVHKHLQVGQQFVDNLLPGGVGVQTERLSHTRRRFRVLFVSLWTQWGPVGLGKLTCFVLSIQAGPGMALCGRAGECNAVYCS